MNFSFSVRAVNAIAQLLTTIAVLVIVYIQYASKSQIDNKDLLMSIFWFFAAIFVVEKIINASSAVLSERETSTVVASLKEIPSLIGRNNIVVFSDRWAAAEHCIAACQTAIGVKNNVIRYGQVSSSAKGDTVYKRWLEAKRISVNKKACPWQEVVSSHLGPTDRQRVLMNTDLNKLGPAYYEGRYIDDKLDQMIPLTIFKFAGGRREVLFGWETQRNKEGRTFLSGNPEIIEFFEEYFEHYFSRADETSIKYQKVAISEVHRGETGATM